MTHPLDRLPKNADTAPILAAVEAVKRELAEVPRERRADAIQWVLWALLSSQRELATDRWHVGGSALKDAIAGALDGR